MNGKRNKYGNVKVKTDDGLTFDSKKEYNRWLELLLLQKGGYITNLERQKKFEIVPKVGRVKRARYYVADFVYITKKGEKVIEDVKSAITKKNPVYTLKRDLVFAKYPEYVFIES